MGNKCCTEADLKEQKRRDILPQGTDKNIMKKEQKRKQRALRKATGTMPSSMDYMSQEDLNEIHRQTANEVETLNPGDRSPSQDDESIRDTLIASSYREQNSGNGTSSRFIHQIMDEYEEA